MNPFYIIPDIEHYAGEDVEYKRKTYCKERGVDKKQAYFAGGDIKLTPKVSTYPEGIAFEKCEDPLQHITCVLLILT